MQDNPITDITEDADDQIQGLDMDRRDWEIAFEPLEGTGYGAIRMGFNIRTLRKYLDAQPFKPRPVMEALDLAMEACFRLPHFRKHHLTCFSSTLMANSPLKKSKC